MIAAALPGLGILPMAQGGRREACATSRHMEMNGDESMPGGGVGYGWLVHTSK